MALGLWIWATLAREPREAAFLAPGEREWLHQRVKQHRVRLPPPPFPFLVDLIIFLLQRIIDFVCKYCYIWLFLLSSAPSSFLPSSAVLNSYMSVLLWEYVSYICSWVHLPLINNSDATVWLIREIEHFDRHLNRRPSESSLLHMFLSSIRHHYCLSHFSGLNTCFGGSSTFPGVGCYCKQMI